MNNWDIDILLWINSHCSAWLDSIMWIVSGKWTWLPLYAFLLVYLWFTVRDKRRPWLCYGLCLLAIALTVVGTDQICHLLKYWIARPRPSHNPDLEGMLHFVRGYTGGLYGHPSSHAANTMAVATFFSMVQKNRWISIGLYTWVAANCYSRMYLGVHYPSDILAGLMIGALVACLAYGALRLLVSDDRACGCADAPPARE